MNTIDGRSDGRFGALEVEVKISWLLPQVYGKMNSVTKAPSPLTAAAATSSPRFIARCARRVHSP